MEILNSNFLKDSAAFYGLIALHMILVSINIAVSIFLVHEWSKPTSPLRTAYFVILNFGYLMNILFSICVFVTNFLYDGSDTLNLLFFVIWHTQCNLGIWEAVLGLNRCTALGFISWHKKVSWFCYPWIRRKFRFIKMRERVGENTVMHVLKGKNEIRCKTTLFVINFRILKKYTSINLLIFRFGIRLP